MHLLQLWLSAAVLIHVAIGVVLLRDAWRERRHRRSLEARLAALRPGPVSAAPDRSVEEARGLGGLHRA